jgi:protein involved in polysaccharide export with SLBB domain
MRQKTAFPAAGLIFALAVFTTVYGQSGLSGASSAAARRPGAGAAGGGQTPFDYSLPAPASAAQPQGASALAPPGAVLPSDNSIDADEYMIGGGDVFFITVVESPSIRYTAAVDQSGKAFIPNVGLVSIGKTSYAEAKKTIAEYVSSILKNPSEIYVTLIQTKNATVSFTGSVRFPGSYEFPGSTRLLDAIRAANDGDLPPASNADLRRVQCASGDSVASYDLLAYLHKGDNSQNPYIYPGDRIRIDATTNSVFISGAIKAPGPGFYPFREGETLKELLSMFTLDNTADTGNIIVYQSAGNSKKTLSLSQADHALQNLDAITVPVMKNHPGLHTAYVSGEIASPGHYPIIENSTSARQLIDMAGGAKPTANIEQAVVIRPMRSLPERLNSGAQHMSAVRPEIGVSLTMASASLDYTIVKLIQYNADKVILEPGDQIYIPKKDSFVYLSGAVKTPGAYPFLQGKDSNYYIAQAGGLNKNADRSNIRVYLKYGDLVQSVEPRCVEPGSVIMVPTSTQYRFLIQVVLPLVSTLATTVGVGIAIYNSR